MTNYDTECKVKMTYQTPYFITNTSPSSNKEQITERFYRPVNETELSPYLIKFQGTIYNLVLDSDDRNWYPTNYIICSKSGNVMLSGINTWITYHRDQQIPTGEQRVACAGGRKMSALIIELKGIRNCPDPDINPMINLILHGVWSSQPSDMNTVDTLI